MEKEQRLSTCPLTIAVPVSMAIEIRRRVNSRKEVDHCYSRNDLMREMIREYLSRHPGGA